MLSGHTDHVRAVMLSADSELVLSGSSDTTVKLWSMRMRRCLSTFSQHNDSVWSLYSSHPRFQTFYSASRDGLIAKTVGAGQFDDQSHRRMSAAPQSRGASLDDAASLTGYTQSGVVCVAVAKEPQGVVKLVAADDSYIWTATKGTKLNRWRDVTVHGSRGVVLGDLPARGAAAPVPTTQASGESGSESDETGELTRRSVIGTWQAFSPPRLGDNPLALHPNHQHGRHRRTHTADHMDFNAAEQGSAEARGQSAVSPVLKAIHAEWAKRGVLRESDSEDQFYDANSHGSGSSSSLAAARGSHSRSQSMGTVQHPTSITSVLASHSAKPMLIPGRSKTELLRSDTAAAMRQNESEMLSVPESPLPDSSFMQAEVHNTLGSPRQPLQVAVTDDGEEEAEAVPVRAKPDETIYGKHGLHRHKILDNKRQVLAQDTRGRVSLWDLLLCCRIYEFPETEEQAKNSQMFPGVCGHDFESIQMAISTEPESVNAWCHVDTKIGALTVRLDESRVWNAEVHVDEVDGVTDDTLRAMGDHERVNIGHWMLKRLFLPYVRSRSKRGPLSRHDAMLLNKWVTQVPAGAVVSA
ncbi:hypothetical protein FBU59_004328, partial [Linderina macrospora]